MRPVTEIIKNFDFTQWFNEREFIKIIDRYELEKLQNNYVIYFEQLNGDQMNSPIDRVMDYETDNDIDQGYGIDYAVFVENKMKLPTLERENDIVIKMSYANIYFEDPCWNSKSTFKINSDNKIGFTRKELALKVFQRFHMLYFLYKNYDMKKGIISNNVIIPDRNRCFSPLMEYDYLDNGIYGVQYDKIYNRWTILLINIH